MAAPVISARAAHKLHSRAIVDFAAEHTDASLFDKGKGRAICSKNRGQAFKVLQFNRQVSVQGQSSWASSLRLLFTCVAL